MEGKIGQSKLGESNFDQNLDQDLSRLGLSSNSIQQLIGQIGGQIMQSKLGTDSLLGVLALCQHGTNMGSSIKMANLGLEYFIKQKFGIYDLLTSQRGRYGMS